jgi:hypothetical protein
MEKNYNPICKGSICFATCGPPSWSPMIMEPAPRGCKVDIVSFSVLFPSPFSYPQHGRTAKARGRSALPEAGKLFFPAASVRVHSPRVMHSRKSKGIDIEGVKINISPYKNHSNTELSPCNTPPGFDH